MYSYDNDDQITATARTELDPKEYYGRKALSTCSNAQALLQTYDQLAGYIGSVGEYTEHPAKLFKKAYCEIVIPLEKVTKEEFDVAREAYINDYPQHFWLPSHFSYRRDPVSDSLTEVIYQIPSSRSKLLSRILEFEQAAEAFLMDVPTFYDEYRTEKAIHDKLISEVSYNKKGKNAHSAYGALIDRQCVCEGYAEIFQYLLYKRGILALRVTGISGRGGRHAWNIVRINGEYYHVDVTWDDLEKEGVSYGYFNLTTAQMLGVHTPSDLPYPLPFCDQTAHNYAHLEKLLIDPADTDLAVKRIAELLTQNNSVRVFLTDPDFDFKEWYFNNVKAISAAAGMTTPYSYSYCKHGYEHSVSLTKKG